MAHNFGPYQLVFGKQSNLPKVFKSEHKIIQIFHKSSLGKDIEKEVDFEIDDFLRKGFI